MSDAYRTLARVIEREAAKLDQLSLKAEPLDGAALERLEILARAMKSLRVQTSAPSDGDPPQGPGEEPVGDLLEAAT